jgi:transcription antitermination factor NusG
MCAAQNNATNILQNWSGLFPREESSWYAVETRVRFEKAICASLRSKGFETFLPLHSSLRRWSDRRQLIELPIFPGYLFVRMFASPVARVNVLRTIGVKNFVGIRGIGSVIPDCEIDALRVVMEQEIPFEHHPYLQVGQHVRIRSGCLENVTGTVISIRGDRSLVISVNLIQRSIALRIRGYEVESIP